MLITGKILEESLIYLNMKRNNVLNGKLRTSSKHMPMAANMSIDASTAMVGRNKNTTH